MPLISLSHPLYLLTTCYNKADSKYNSPLCNGIRTWHTWINGGLTPLPTCKVNLTDWKLPYTNPWLENFGYIPSKKDSTPGVLCASKGFIFVCGCDNWPWAHECLDSWRMGGPCLLGCLTTLITILKLLTGSNSSPDDHSKKQKPNNP